MAIYSNKMNCIFNGRKLWARRNNSDLLAFENRLVHPDGFQIGRIESSQHFTYFLAILNNHKWRQNNLIGSRVCFQFPFVFLGRDRAGSTWISRFRAHSRGRSWSGASQKSYFESPTARKVETEHGAEDLLHGNHQSCNIDFLRLDKIACSPNRLALFHRWINGSWFMVHAMCLLDKRGPRPGEGPFYVKPLLFMLHSLFN